MVDLPSAEKRDQGSKVQCGIYNRAVTVTSSKEELGLTK